MNKGNSGQAARIRLRRRHSSPGAPVDGRDGANYMRDLRLTYLIHDVSRMRRATFDQLMKPLGVTRAQWWVLAFLSRQDGMMQTQLAGVLDVGKASLGALIDRLEESGWVERRADPSDRRARRVYMTRKARGLVREMRRADRAFNGTMLRGISEGERDELVRLLSKIKHAIAQMGASAIETESASSARKGSRAAK